MRESISYGMDLISGKKVEVKKQKPDSRVKGTATIELFDEKTGQKVYEAKTENLININVGKKAYMDFFYYKLKEDSDVFQIRAPFKHILLTDYNEPEKDDLSYHRGKLIGYAYKRGTYSGNDILRGTINETETKLDVDGDGLLHFVFDFPTHAANGVFNTVWWCGYMEATLRSNSVLKFEYDVDRTDTIKFGALHRMGEKWICMLLKNSESSPGVNYPLYALILNSDFTLYKKIDIKEKLGSWGSSSLAWGTSDNGIVLNKTDTTNESIWIIDIETERVSKLSLKLSYGSVNIRKGKLYFSGYEFLEYAINGNEITLLKNYGYGEYYDFSEYDGYPTFYTDKGKLCYIRDGVVVETPIKKSESLRIDFDNKDLNYAYRVTRAKYEEGKVKLDIAKYSFYPEIGAQTLLPEPVTKTPTNTMKIQYDFKVEKV